MYKGEGVVLQYIKQEKEVSIPQLARMSKLPEDSVRRIVESLKTGGYVSTRTVPVEKARPTDELLNYRSVGFPEYSVFKKSGSKIDELSAVEKSIGIRWAKVKNFIDIRNGQIIAIKDESEVETEMNSLNEAVDQLKENKQCDPLIKELLFERKLLSKEITKTVLVSPSGKEYVATEFDPNIPGRNAPLGKNHPITKITKKMKTIMSELGFQEMEGDIIESSFWNFDALFQPQDHPARELADTFYLKGEMPLPNDKALVERVRKAHESGWKYKWDPEEASKSVLRTHTTALSARYVSSIKDKGPRKYFAIGRVFRNEATDYKHLAEFHQVEGIIVWENAKFTDLLGVLKEFYRKLGFEKIRFRPSFFPYTEPSLEIEVYFEKRKQWLELGGAGIFRPEVSIPLAGVYPVLAWGLSLERPLMLLLELEDIRTFYKNDLDFLVGSRLEI